MSFWSLSTGEAPTGTAEASFVSDFSIIPDGTTAPAQIKEFKLEDSNQSYPSAFYEITYKVTDGQFKGREVRQKIKCFDAKPNIADRSLNMLKRVYDLTSHKPAHVEAPSTADLRPMVGRIVGIKIREFIGTKQDGTPSNGNYVSEVNKFDKDFEVVVGSKLEVPPTAISSALTRNAVAGLPNDGSDIPF